MALEKPIVDQLQKPLIHERAQDEFIFDSDFHLHLPIENLYPYIKEKKILTKLEKFGPPPRHGTGKLKGSYAADSDNRAHFDRPQGIALKADEITQIMDELALDAVIVEPGTHFHFVGNTKYPIISNAIVRAYHDYLRENVLDTSRGIYGTIILPHWDIDQAIEELDRVGSHQGFVAGQNWMHRRTFWGDIKYDPIFEKLVSLDLPLFLHVTARSESVTSFSNRTITERSMLDHGFSLLANVSNLVMTGVFEKYPDLDVVVQESGTNWVPYIAHRLDENYLSWPNDIELIERMYPDDEYFQRMPSEYVFDNIYTATQPITYPNISGREVKQLLEVCHAKEMFMYSSDWPHFTVDPANWIFENDMDEATRNAILYENTEEVIRLPSTHKELKE